MGTATSSNEFVELLTGLIRSGSYVSIADVALESSRDSRGWHQ